MGRVDRATPQRQIFTLKNGKILVRRGVVRVGGEHVVGDPKSSAGRRDVAIPPHLIPVVRQHLGDHAEWGKDWFCSRRVTGGHLAHGSFFKTWDRARTAAGRPDLHFHDLRHTGAVLAAQTGATLAELMGGRVTPRQRWR